MVINITVSGDLHLHEADLSSISSKLDTIILQSQQLKGAQDKIMVDLTALIAAVADEKTVVDGAVTLITGFETELQTLLTNAGGNSVDPSSIQALLDSVNAQKTTLAAKVAEGTTALNNATAPAGGIGGTNPTPPVA